MTVGTFLAVIIQNKKMTARTVPIVISGSAESKEDVGGVFMTLAQEAVNIIESMPKKNQQIVIELLRVMSSQPVSDENAKKNTDEKMKNAALGLAGLWSSHENAAPVDEVVRNMRKGRFFDT